MSLLFTGTVTDLECFPRVSGDEPYLSESMGVSNEFSPRERG